MVTLYLMEVEFSSSSSSSGDVGEPGGALPLPVLGQVLDPQEDCVAEVALVLVHLAPAHLHLGLQHRVQVRHVRTHHETWQFVGVDILSSELTENLCRCI